MQKSIVVPDIGFNKESVHPEEIHSNFYISLQYFTAMLKKSLEWKKKIWLNDWTFQQENLLTHSRIMTLAGSKENQMMKSKKKKIIGRINSKFRRPHFTRKYMCLWGVKNILTMKLILCDSQAFEGIGKCNFLKENFYSRIIYKWGLLSGKTERTQIETRIISPLGERCRFVEWWSIWERTSDSAVHSA